MSTSPPRGSTSCSLSTSQAAWKRGISGKRTGSRSPGKWCRSSSPAGTATVSAWSCSPARVSPQCPLTLDYDVLLEFLGEVEIASRSWDGTAIGVALINSCNRLRDADGKSRVVILLTDGVNNAGEIDPMTAAAAAEATGIRVYTIGVGARGSPVPGRPGRGLEFDEEILERIAETTGGQYYHATSREKLKQVYEEIGKLETTPVTSAVHLDFSERYGRFLRTGSVLLLLGFVLANTRFRRLP